MRLGTPALPVGIPPAVAILTSVAAVCSSLRDDALAAPAIENLGATEAVLEGEWLAYSQKESFSGEDLDGDGDRDDIVLRVRHLATPETSDVVASGVSDLVVSGDWLAFLVSERDRGEDLNGDGDVGAGDRVLHVHSLSSGETTNLRLAESGSTPSRWFSGDRLVFFASEGFQGADLNGDGDSRDDVVHIYELSTGEMRRLEFSDPFGIRTVVSQDWIVLFRDLSPSLFHVHNISSGTTTDLRGPPVGIHQSISDPQLSRDWLVFKLPPASDEIGPEDLNSTVRAYHLATGRFANVSSYRGAFRVTDEWLTFGVYEATRDRNDDGDRNDVVASVHHLPERSTTNLRLAINDSRGDVPLVASGNWGLFPVSEAGQGGADLNGDGDSEDSVLHVHRLDSGQTENLSLAGSGQGVVFGDRVAFVVSEDAHGGRDLNGDGDTEDEVAHLRDLSTGETMNLRVAGSAFGFSETWLAVLVPEVRQGEDLNGDGDRDDRVLRVHQLASGESTNVGLAGTGRLAGDWLLVEVSERQQGEDLDGDGDQVDTVVHVVDLARLGGSAPGFVRGDCDGDGHACSGVHDALTLLNWRFRRASPPRCVAACDLDASGDAGLPDAIYGLTFCFAGTAAPVAPFPSCGFGTDSDAALGCATPPASCE